MTLDANTFPVQTGDSILIPPGTAHCIENRGTEALRILCCCAASILTCGYGIARGAPCVTQTQRRR
jgi:uncharacterized cupin superfamily protein